MGTSERRPYLTATVLSQGLLNQCQDNLTNRLEIIADVYNLGTDGEDIHISDRAKYVGEVYYEARVAFPNIERTLGDWLANELEFSSLDLKINNSDGIYNHLLPGSGKYSGFVGKRVVVSVGLGEIAASYITVFSGQVTDVSGFKRDTSSFSLICRSDFERINQSIPNQTLTNADWPYLEDDMIGLAVPIIYGDWTVSLRPEAPEVRAFVVNGNDPLVNSSIEPPDPLVGSVAVRAVIASVPLKSVDTASVVLFRGSTFFPIPAGDVSVVGGSDNQVIDIAQKGFLIEGDPWIYARGDEFFLKCVGVDLLSWTDNIVYQAKDILKRFGGLIDGNFDTSWMGYASKAAPAENAILGIKSRIWQQESRQALEYALSLLEQVRLEIYVDRSGYFSISSLHLDDLDPTPSFTIRNSDVLRGSFNPSTDERNQFNRAKGDFGYSPVTSQNFYSTHTFRNEANIIQIGREISKLVTFPNLYVLADVENQIMEILKLSAYVENVELSLTSRAFLQDIGDDIAFNINIGSVVFDNNVEPVTGKIRLLRYNPKGMSIDAKIWCFQMLPFPGSEKTLISGITGGSTAIITQE